MDAKDLMIWFQKRVYGVLQNIENATISF